MAVDVAGQRLFVAALGNNSLEVIDLRDGKRIRSISELHEPQGVAYVPGANQCYVACGGDGAVKVYDAKSFDLVTTLRDLDEADNVRYDAAAKRVYVGYGSGALAIIDATTAKRVGDIKLAGHPESFQLEQNGNRVFANVPTAEQAAVVDREKRVVVATWKLSEAKKNFPMALDEENRRLFVGCRQSAALLVLDSDSGKDVAVVAIDGDTDDVFYDRKRSRVYISCGAGFIDVLDCNALLPYSLTGKIPTASGARTSLFVPELNRLYLAVPHRGNQPAEVRVYETTGN
jgi:DNA-binding beta-propeller fold protein YncE